MEIVAITFAIVAIVLLTLLLKILSVRKQEKIEYKKHDEMLTKYVSDNLDMEKELAALKENLDRQQDVAKEIKTIQEQSRALKHDMKNHTLVILSYLDENKIDEAKEYAGELINKLNKMYTYVNVGNSLLNYIVNSKLSKAKELGIDIKAEIENLTFEYMESVDFSSLLNNLLDNAIEAAIVSQAKKLEVQISSKKGFDVIIIKNSIDESVLEKNPNLVTIKEEPNHGYGMKQIKSIVEKYDGNIDIYEKNEMFIISIMLG